MKVEKIKITKKDKRGTIYNCDKVGFIIRKKGTISADHAHKKAETLYLVQGGAKLTVGNKTKKIKAPAKIAIGKNVYHKLVALTEVMIIRS